MTGKQRAYFATGIGLCFFVISLFLAMQHVLWIDEAFHYLLPRDSPGIRALIANGTVSGHPMLWNILLYLLKQVWPGIVGMQVLHCLFASLSVFLLCRYAPFKVYELLLMVFGYYLFFEYNVISKNYAPGFCLLFGSLVLYGKNKNPVLIAILLAAAANMHLFTLFSSAALYLYMRPGWRSGGGRMTVMADAILAAGILLSLWQIIPGEETIRTYRDYDVPQWLSADRLGRSLAMPARGLLNIPDFRLHTFWNTSLLFNTSAVLTYLLSLGLLAAVFAGLKSDKKLLFLFFAPVFAIMCFVYLAPLATGVRYWGYSYILLVICAWLLFRSPGEHRVYRRFFTAILFLQFAVSFPVVYDALSKPFSNAKAAAATITTKGHRHLPLYVQNVSMGPSLSAYASRPVFYPASGRLASYTFDAANSLDDDAAFLSRSVLHLRQSGADSCLLFLNTPPDQPAVASLPGTHDLKFISSHTGAMIGSENYFIYLLYERQ